MKNSIKLVFFLSLKPLTNGLDVKQKCRHSHFLSFYFLCFLFISFNQIFISFILIHSVGIFPVTYLKLYFVHIHTHFVWYWHAYTNTNGE